MTALRNPKEKERSPGRLVRNGLRELWSGASRLLVALALLNASNYVFHVVVSRFLGPVRYGALAALLAIVMVLSVPLSVLQTVVAKRIAALRAEGRADETRSLATATARALYPGAVVAAAVLLAASPATASLLHVGGVPAALLAPYLLLSLLASVPLGVLQGELRFSALATAVVAGVAVRLGAGIGLVWAGLGVPGAMLATVLGQAASLAVAAGLVGLHRDAWRRSRASLELLRGEVRVALLTLGSFWLLAEVDLALARHYLEPRAAGLYSSAGVIARAVLFLPAVVSIVALPRFAAWGGRGSEARRWLGLSLGAVVCMVLFALSVLAALREPIMAITFGERFRQGADLLPLLGVAMGLLAVVNLLVYFHVAAGSLAYRLVLAGVGLEAVLIGFLHRSAQEIALVVMGVAALVAVLLYQAASAICRWSPPSREAEPDDGDRARRTSLEDDPSLELSLVLPCYNAGSGLRDVLAGIRGELETVPSWEIIVVSDGSTDETLRVAEDFAEDGVRVLHYPRRAGKGHALRVGLSEARGRYIGFIDADGDIAPDAIRPFLEIMRLYRPDIVLGSKRHPLSEVQYPLARRGMSWTYHKLVRVLFRVNVRDTQTGLKLIRRETLAAVLPLMLEKRYAFDLELLVVARSLGFRRVFEAPVRIDFRFSGHVNLGAVFRILLDTMAISYRRYVLGTYRRIDGASGRRATRARGRLRTALSSDGDLAQRDGRLRILVLNWRDIRNPEAGGAEVVTHEVASRWVASGHEVEVLTSRFRRCQPVETVDGVRIRRVGRLRTGSFHLRVQRELARLEGFDLVIDEINTIPFFTPLWRRSLPPTVALIHQLARDVLDAELPRPAAAVGRWLEPKVLRLYADLPVVTVSESTRQDLLALGLRDVSVVPDGRDEPPDLDGIAKDPVPTFLFVGRLTPNKRPDHAVEAFRSIRDRLPDARLWIVGRGPMERKLRKRLPEGAEMLGFLARDELYRRMARAHCLLVPSVREGWGLVVIEGNSVGTPAVGYDVPGIRDSIGDGVTGLLASPGDPASLADRAVSLITQPATYPAMRDQAMMWARRFSWEATARELMALISEAVAERGAGPTVTIGGAIAHEFLLRPEPSELPGGMRSVARE